MSTPGVEITDSFSEPFFDGGGAEQDDYSLPVSINGRGFQIDTASQDFVRKSIKLLNTQQAQTGQDYAIEPPTVWRRSTESWHSGADQARYDRADSIDTRYHRSIGIDPWTKYGISLLNDTRHLTSFSGLPTEEYRLVTILNDLWVMVHDEVWHFTSINDPAPTQHVLTDIGLEITSDGENVYTLASDGVVERRDATGTWSTFYTQAGLNPAKAMLAYVKGFIILGDAASLYNITNGTAVLIYQHPLGDWWWRSADEGLSVIYVLGGIGDRWHVHAISIASNGATLDPPRVATTLPDGEIAYTVASYMGYVFIGVNDGWRFAMPDGSGNLTYGQLIETAGPVTCFEGQGRFIWFGLSMQAGTKKDWDDDVDQYTIYSEHAGLGRADLSTFIAPNTPGAASDLMAPVFGLVRSVATVGGEWGGIGTRVFAVDGEGVYVEDAGNLVPVGWLEQGAFTFNSTDKKMGLYAQVFTEPLHGTVEVHATTDTDTKAFTKIGYSSTEGSVSLGNMPFQEPFNSIELRYYLYRDSLIPTLGPRVVRSEFRAINIPGRATEWHIPLLLHEEQAYSNTTFGRTVVDDYDFLMSLVRSRQQFTYREGDRFWSLHANDFVWQPGALTSDRKTFNGTFVLVAREIN